MGTQVEGAGGTDVSFSNTPQAKGDDFTISATTDLSSLNFDVLANDLGGEAKTLYSIDDGVSVSTATKKYAPADLLESDRGDAPETVGDDGLGSTIQIVDGKVVFAASEAFLDLLNATATGTYIDVSFTYAIQLGNGTLSWATASLHFEGRSDGGDGGGELSDLGKGHGYWKEHESDWNVAPQTLYETLFGGVNSVIDPPGSTPPYSDPTLEQAINVGGGGENLFAREAVTAYLNAIDEKNGLVYDFAYTPQQVLDMVTDAYTAGGLTMAEITQLFIASHEQD